MIETFTDPNQNDELDPPTLVRHRAEELLVRIPGLQLADRLIMASESVRAFFRSRMLGRKKLRVGTLRSEYKRK